MHDLTRRANRRLVSPDSPIRNQSYGRRLPSSRAALSCAVALGMILALAPWQAAHADARTNWVNVMDYIEKVGPIKKIDVAQRTKAIQEAAASKGGTLYFPPGNYTINDTIDFRGKSLVGEGGAINMTDAGKDILFSKGGSMLHIEGLTLRGGKNQIRIDTGGIGGGHAYRISDCNFYDATGFAIYVHVNMTVLTVERVQIKGCAQGVFANLDSIIFRDSHCCSGRLAGKAFLEFHCPMAKVADCVLTPQVGTADQRWIDNYCSLLIVKDTRFGGEGGGFTPVVNFSGLGLSKPQISIENCFLLNTSNLKRKCAVYCEKVPNTISIRDSWLTCAPILVAPQIDLANYFINVPPQHLSYTVENCVGYLGDIPEGLKKPVIHQVEPKYLKDEEIKPLLDAAEQRLAETNAAAKDAGPLHYKIDRPAQGLSLDHVQQTNPAKFIEAVPPNCEWVVEDCADAEFVTNDKYFGVRVVGDDVIIITRQEVTGNAWVMAKGITVDLDKFPLMSHAFKLGSSWRKPHYGPTIMMVIDRETGLTACTGKKSSSENYRVNDLRESFGGGVHTFDIKVYYSAWTSRFIYPDLESKSMPAPPGTYCILDFIRFEAE